MNDTIQLQTAPRILVVEDEPFIAMLLEDMLDELGFTITASFPQVAEAEKYLAGADVDIALLDVNVGMEKIDPVADLLAARGCPFIFTTGYGQKGVPENHAGRPVLQKPFKIDDLANALQSQLTPKI
ncbi:MAG: response regulator [Methylovirgula sp.]|uniref:response regulator n=1 Tax=Methylovirgula sp. TaxID=1978224 RepID=UPI003076196C